MSLEFHSITKPIYNKKTKMTEKKEFFAYCSSYHCAPPILNKSSGRLYAKRDSFRRAQKNVPASTTVCPDCGFFLVWKQKV